MAPEYPKKLAVLDLKWEDQKLRGILEYTESAQEELLRVRWAVENQPEGYFAIGSGVAFIYNTPGVVVMPPSLDAIPEAMGNSRYRWQEGMPEEQQWLMFILILPEGYTVTNPFPKPVSAKEFNGRLALYWVLDGGNQRRARIAWTLKKLDQELSLEVEKINSNYSSESVPLGANLDIVSPYPSNLVFISYSHSDSRWLKRLQVHLKPLERQGTIERWDDTKIQAGTKWRHEIERALRSTKVAVLLISADFIASDFIEQNELPPLLKAAEDKGTVILPVIVSPCMFEETKSLSQFHAVNPPSQPLSSMRKNRQEETLVKVSREIRTALASDLPARAVGGPARRQAAQRLDISPILSPNTKLGTTKESAVPFGGVQLVYNGMFEIRILDSQHPARNFSSAFVKGGNDLVSVKIRVVCSAKSNAKCVISPSYFKMTDSSGVINGFEPSALQMENVLPQARLLGGASVEGWLGFQTKQGSNDLWLLYDWQGETIFFEIP